MSKRKNKVEIERISWNKKNKSLFKIGEKVINRYTDIKYTVSDIRIRSTLSKILGNGFRRDIKIRSINGRNKGWAQEMDFKEVKKK